MLSANPKSVKYSVVVPVYNNATDLRVCLSSLSAQSLNHDQFEVIVVDNNSTDDSFSVAKSAGVICLREQDFQSSYAARNRGIKAAQGAFIVFLDSDCVAHPDWLTHIDSKTDDTTIGCFAGEILSVEPATTTEHFSESIGLLRQRGPLSGWHFKPYAQTANATYRKEVFEKVGLFDPTMKSGGDAVLSWRMLDKTNYRIHFVSEAIVYHHHRTSVPDLWAQFRRYGGGKMAWALSQSNYQPPAVTKLEAELVTVFDKLVTKLESTGFDAKETIFPLLRSMTQVAHYSGYLQDLLRLISRDAPSETWPNMARASANACNICGSRAFVPGPRKRMVGTKAPLCLQCGSLERHRVLYSVLNALGRGQLALWTCLSVGEPLLNSLNWFEKTSHIDLAGLAAKGTLPPHDLVVAMNLLSESGNNLIEDTVETLVTPLGDNGLLVLIDWTSNHAGSDLASDRESRIAQHLPNVRVRSCWVQDLATGAVLIVTLASPDAAMTSRTALRLNREALTK